MPKGEDEAKLRQKVYTKRLDSHGLLAHIAGDVMRVILVADLHNATKQFDWPARDGAIPDATLLEPLKHAP